MQKSLPSKILVIDVETTGLSDCDKIVSFGAVRLESELVEGRTLDINLTHLIFDPAFPSHPGALKVHGYSDWILRHQTPFPLYAGFVKALFLKTELVVSHNVDFDLRFLSREMSAAGETLPNVQTYCTMLAERKLGLPANLDAACRRAGLASRGKRHSALDDAWRATQLFLHQHGLQSSESSQASREPTNLTKPPRRAKGDAPDRDWEIEIARLRRFSEEAMLLRQEILPQLLVLRWISGASYNNDKNIEVIFRAYAEREAGIYSNEIINRFPEVAFAEISLLECEWKDVRAALDTLRFDLPKRRRLRDAIERCIRSDGNVAEDEIGRLRDIAEYLGGQIAIE
jgi:DNA polymerase III epsilon subunit-like protein